MIEPVHVSYTSCSAESSWHGIFDIVMDIYDVIKSKLKVESGYFQEIFAFPLFAVYLRFAFIYMIWFSTFQV